ncbi:hypothetical protein K1T71_010990 [Dendrolimus kikuchii]|uniref:Uncharacterized protein n=1 Tax=Dendrolimus kikuchii TaxID=765133 RepID=A0ACC1CQQ9_9NEOP|nr:hypothetical protein K1T71_010990 [Dendrolimus kikuchii]
MHPPYSPDLAPSDFHLFRSLQNSLGSVRLTSQEDCQNHLTQFFDQKPQNFYSNGITSTELPGRKYQCWETLGDNFKHRKEYLKQKYMEESTSLISFFSIRGTDRIVYKNNIGSYQVDELNHQIYQSDSGMGIFHVNCDGQFMEISDKEIYYYDENGRYIYENGEKLYQSIPCASKYKLDSDTLLVKVTEDCGHADRGNEKCKMAINDLTDVEMLPTVEPIDISRTLDSETVNYLWKSFGAILPEALHDVGVSKSKNPIHVLAHKLLAHKYSRTIGELRKKNKEADDFKTEIYRQRREKAVAASKAWKAKQVKRRKPEESDDTLHWAALNAYSAEREFIISQDFFNT